MLKLLDRILDGKIKAVVEMEIGEKPQRFRKGRGEEDMAIVFIYLENASGTVPREMAVAKLR